MSRTSFEALEADSCAEVEGSTLRRPLLCDAAEEDDDDEEIVSRSQLLSANERSNRRRFHRCQNSLARRARCWATFFALFMLVGLFASVRAACSCNLIAIQYNKGGIRLSITAVGFFNYQREEAVHPERNFSSDGSDQVTKEVCVYYGEKQHMQVDLRHFFPSNQALQVYSIVGPSFYFAGVFGILMFLLILSMHPEVLKQEETMDFPPTGITSAITMAAVFFLISGVFHLYSVHGLMNYSDPNAKNYQSAICNPTYSTCHLGPGGKWAAFAIFCCLFCGSVSCVAAYFVACRAGRTTRCCGV